MAVTTARPETEAEDPLRSTWSSSTPLGRSAVGVVYRVRGMRMRHDLVRRAGVLRVRERRTEGFLELWIVERQQRPLTQLLHVEAYPESKQRRRNDEVHPADDEAVVVRLPGAMSQNRSSRRATDDEHRDLADQAADSA